MNFKFTEEEEITKELASQILGGNTSFDRLRQVERDATGPGFDRELWQKLAESNLIGLSVAEGLGGQGFSFLALCLLFEEAGRTLAPVPLLESVVLSLLPIEKFGSDSLKKSLVPKVLSGEVVLTAAFAELGDPPLSRTHRQDPRYCYCVHCHNRHIRRSHRNRHIRRRRSVRSDRSDVQSSLRGS